VTQIPILRPLLPDLEQLAPYLRQIDASRIYSNHGPLVRRFEERLASRYGLAAPCVTTVSNATAGLTVALQAMGCRAGSLCIVPAWTFIASPLAILAAGLVPYFIDVDPTTWAIDPDRVEAALAGAPGPVGAVMPVAPFGRPLPIEPWDAFAARRGIPVVIDAAAAFDAQQPGAAPCVVSLHATKAFGIGEGGFVVSRDGDLIARIHAHSNFGFLGERLARVPGQNAKLSEYHAAVGLAALDDWSATRAAIAQLTVRYARALAATQAAPQPGFGDQWAALTCVAVLPEGTQDAVESALQTAGIDTRRWWGLGAHAHPATAEFPCTDLTHTASLARTSIGLPFHRSLSERDIETVARHVDAAVRGALERARAARHPPFADAASGASAA
jgi:dTDP-4-amino-4,6-dideoxygalactose transaminase